MTRRYWIIIVLCILFNIACGFVPLAIPTNTDIAPAVTMDSLTNTLTVSHIVTFTPTVTCFGIVQVQSLNLRERPSYYAPADGKGLKLGQVVTIIDTFSDWYQVETSDGRHGFARAEYINPCIK